MMYNEKLAVAIKSAGKVLREFKDTIYVPFGAEYSIFIKNLNSVRALVKVSIDNQPVDDNGEGFVINANNSLDLERFLKNGNLKQGNRFKFIERTAKIEQHKGIGVEDGLIRVEFQYEKRAPKIEEVHHYKHYYHNYYWDDYYWPRRPYYYHSYLCNSDSFGGGGSSGSGLIGSANGAITTSNSGGASGGTISSAAGGARTFTTNNSGSLTVSDSQPVSCNLVQTGGLMQNAGEAVQARRLEMINEAGITVPGSKSDQEFVMVCGFPLEAETHVIVLKLLGETAKGKKIVQAVTVKTKQKCPTCGHMNKATTKFCSECGTALEIV